jgi:hypothetical protein
MPPMRATRLRLVVAAGLAALAGCIPLTRKDLRNAADGDVRVGALGEAGRLVVPKQCALKLAVLTRPLGDPGLGEALWRVVDSQVVGSEATAALEANGLRAGIATGELPQEVRAILDAPPPNQVHPALVIVPDGDSTQVELGAARDELDLLLNRNGSVGGKRYKDVKGYLRLSASRSGESGVALRVTPELHHGPVRPGWGAAPGGGAALAPAQLVMKNGQQEETFRDLAATLKLHVGQVAVIGPIPEARGSLGRFLMTATEANSDREVQKVLMVWAARSDDEVPEPRVPPGLQPVDPPLEEGPPKDATPEASPARKDDEAEAR